jgi:hypothetical protein
MQINDRSTLSQLKPLLLRDVAVTVLPKYYVRSFVNIILFTEAASNA